MIRRLLSDDHRARIRERCLLFVDEEVDSVGILLAFLVGSLFHLIHLHRSLSVTKS